MQVTFTMFIPVIVLLICFIVRVPVGFSMLAAAAAYLLAVGKNLGLVADAVMGSLYSSTTIIAAPLFIFTANIMTSSKVSDYMYAFAKAIFGKVRGATAYMNIVVSLIFAGMSGSAVADAAGSGLMEIEEMRKDGYDIQNSNISSPESPLQLFALRQNTPDRAHQGILQNFANAITQGEPLIAPGEEGIHELMLSNAAYLSSAQGGAPVSLPVDADAFDAFLSARVKGSSLHCMADGEYAASDYQKRWQVTW